MHAQFRKAEIQQLDTGFGDENVRGLQVAMGDALFVRGVECIANLRGVLQGLIEGQGPLERSALDILHDQVIGTNIVQRTDVGMIQRANGASFALESLAELRGLETLIATSRPTRVIARLPHLAHSARADGREDFVGTEFFAG